MVLIYIQTDTGLDFQSKLEAVVYLAFGNYCYISIQNFDQPFCLGLFQYAL